VPGRSQIARVSLLKNYSIANETRTSLGLSEDAPLKRAVKRSGTIIFTPILPDCIIATRGYDFCEGLPSKLVEVQIACKDAVRWPATRTHGLRRSLRSFRLRWVGTGGRRI
jgi:hypothetical protein